MTKPAHRGSLPSIDSLWDFDDAARSEAAFRALLEQTDGAGVAGYRAEVLTQLARAQGLQGKFAQAVATLAEAEGICKESDTVALIRLLLEKGRVLNSSGDPQRAVPLFVQAMEMATQAGRDVDAVDAAHMLAICSSGKEELRWNERALGMAESSKDPAARKWLGALYNNIGWTYHEAGEYKEALRVFTQAAQWRERETPGLPARIARWAVGRTLRSLGRVEEALNAQLTLKQEHLAAGTSGAFVYEELGECFHHLGRPDEARGHFRRAYELLSEDDQFVRDQPERLGRMKRLGGHAD